MSSEYRYGLEKGSKKHICPRCGKKKFVRYIDRETGEYLPEQYGKCDRADNCGYHLNPYKDGYAKEAYRREKGLLGYSSPRIPTTVQPMPQQPPQQPKERYYIPYEILERETLAGHEQNGFLNNLIRIHGFPKTDTTKVAELYYLGTWLRGYMAGGVCLPYISSKGEIHAVQVKSFDARNHTKKIYGTNFLHALIAGEAKSKGEQMPDWLKTYQESKDKIQCPFGEHLLSRYPKSTVILVEAPKTAIYGTLYYGFPEKDRQNPPIWLAVGARDWINETRLKELRGRNVLVFPDLSKDGSTFELWQKKCTEIGRKLGGGTRIEVSDLLEHIANDKQRQGGDDLADFIVEQDWRQGRRIFPRQPEPQQPEQQKDRFCRLNETKGSYLDDLHFEGGVLLTGDGYPALWDTVEGTPYITDAEKEVIKRKAGEYSLPNTPRTVEKPEPPNREILAAEIEQLKQFFAGIELRGTTVQLSRTETIRDIPKFLNTHFEMLYSSQDKNSALPYLDRLRKLRGILSTEKREGA